MKRRVCTGLALLSLAATACVSHEREEAPAVEVSAAVDELPGPVSNPSQVTESKPWDCSNRPVESGRSRTCRSCFHVDEKGLGECRLDAHRANASEFVAALRHSASGKDSCKSWDDSVAFPLGAMLVELAERDGFAKLADIKHAVGVPKVFGYPEFEDLEVRVQSGNNGQGDEWGGLTNIVYVGERPSRPRTCCTTPECMGTDYRCVPDAPGRLAWCEGLSERALGTAEFDRRRARLGLGP